MPPMVSFLKSQQSFGAGNLYLDQFINFKMFVYEARSLVACTVLPIKIIKHIDFGRVAR